MMDVSESVSHFTELEPSNWHYRMRRQKQEILPSIFLGPYHCVAKSQLEDLKASGITHILCVRQEIEARCVKVNFPEHFVYKVMEMRDDPTESIIAKFPEARDFIDSCLNCGGKILIHGVNGMSRSAALLLAYIMEKYEFTFDEAYKLVKKRRYCVDVNYGFRTQLKEYEPIYRARNMSKNWDQASTSGHFSRKRHASDDDNCNMWLNLQRQ